MMRNQSSMETSKVFRQLNLVVPSIAAETTVTPAREEPKSTSHNSIGSRMPSPPFWLVGKTKKSPTQKHQNQIKLEKR